MSDGGNEDAQLLVRLYKPSALKSDVNQTIQLAKSFLGHHKSTEDIKIVRATSLNIVPASEGILDVFLFMIEIDLGYPSSQERLSLVL